MIEQTATFSPDWISTPGDTILDLLEERGWKQTEFAERIGFSPKHVSQLINGKSAITEDAAIRLERVLGSSARFWMNRESQYREALARETELEALEHDVAWLKEIPIKHMVDSQWMRKCKNKAEQVSEALKFFGVASVDAWRNKYASPLAAFRASGKFDKQPGAVSAWLRQGERRASDIRTAPFNKGRFKATLEELRALTNETNPSVFIPALMEACAASGVAVVFEPAPTGCPVSGATKWIASDKTLLMLSLRHKTNDHLWFSFFHEAGHLLLHGKKMLFIEGNGLDNEQEDEANQFAANLLIPKQHEERLILLGHSATSISAFAKELGIAPGIVIGRLQNEGLLPWGTRLNSLKARYQWQ
ncbi:MAG: addiction module antidote protein, HigA family [Zetaproteobacteria bacterium CG_4_9_14_3_um_filter_49_83]|nr:MAG: addiction module antidote protein, HigA family [Zetaproteobacteria bacterium CG1_02_49_23]PIQ34482.1 MAG: addiction module antidote protein, HigA family [Zetaproteobacteria bacterium CG17_big_fil_post_rev_8_21_14_2_50_50_13]PIV29257.1 MAG: addiction module antidote protein, HigA family [Zetaproteobacteria bacterium CG02_land_8_20_14_3_00_50_9]PIY56091.1 MAG: addiction module antidote protein, HigA family [Zetaproteobacteria bacterium CG_4_10_14_0_8_um_filter_49_80]PJA34531.1 MAG: addict